MIALPIILTVFSQATAVGVQESAGQEAQAAGRLQEAFVLYLQEIQTSAETASGEAEYRLRERIVRLAARLESPPAVPEAAVKHLTRGLVLFKEAHGREGYAEALAELAQAARIAPWHPPILYNLALVQEKLDRYAAAAANLKLYLLAAGAPPQGPQVQAKIYELELRGERAAKRRQEAAGLRAGEAASVWPGLGILISTLSADAAAAHGVPGGRSAVRVLDLETWSAAHEAGIREGDIIYEVSGTRVHTAQALSTLIGRAPAGSVLSVRLIRNRQPMTIEATVADKLARARAMCLQGEPQACSELGVQYLGGVSGIASDLPRGVALLEIACEDGSADGCDGLAWTYQAGRGATKDPARAALLARRACDGGSESGCERLASMYLGGQGVTKDAGQALGILQASCDKGHSEACIRLARLLRSGDAVTKDPGRASAILTRACDGGDSAACGSLGQMHFLGEVPGDRARGLALMERSCAEGIAVMCGALGLAYDVGEGVGKDSRRAAALYEDACAANDPESCHNLALMLIEGRGGPKDERRAAKLYEQACGWGVAASCTNLGVSYLEGRGLPKDASRAASLYKRACDAGDDVSCSNLGAMYQKGDVLPKDAAMAASLYRKACERGYQKACKWLQAVQE